jgi:hypothetical protein
MTITKVAEFNEREFWGLRRPQQSRPFDGKFREDMDTKLAAYRRELEPLSRH